MSTVGPMRERRLGQRMTSHSAAGPQRKLSAGSIGLSVVSMNCTFIKPDAVRSRCTPAWLFLTIKADGRGSHCVMLSLVKSLESIRRRIEGGFYAATPVSQDQIIQRREHIPVGAEPPTEVGKGDKGPQTLLSLASSSRRRSSLAILSPCSNWATWSSFSSSRTRQISSREAKGYCASIATWR